MNNKGIDFQLIGKGKIGSEVRYELTVNNSFLKNEITYLAPNVTFFGGFSGRGVSPIRNQVGEGISSFFGYKQIGYFNSAEEVKNSPKQSGAALGRFKYADISGPKGVPDGEITPDDRTIIGSPIPTFTGGITLDVKYKNWDLTTNLFASLGNDIFNLSKWYTDFQGTFEGSAKGVRAKESWTPALGNNAKAPIWESAANISTSSEANSWYVEDGSYMRVQNLTIGYTLPTNITSKLGIKKARISGSANNIFTITGYDGLDPAVGGAVDTTFGIDVGNYPTTRSFNIGLNLSF